MLNKGIGLISFEGKTVHSQRAGSIGQIFTVRGHRGQNLEQFIGIFWSDKSLKETDSGKFTTCSNVNGAGIRDNLYDKIVTTYRIYMT